MWLHSVVCYEMRKIQCRELHMETTLSPRNKTKSSTQCVCLVVLIQGWRTRCGAVHLELGGRVGERFKHGKVGAGEKEDSCSSGLIFEQGLN